MLKSLSLLTLLLVTATAAAYSFPPLTGRVVDQADLVWIDIDRTLPEEVVRAVEAGLPYTRVTVHADPWPPDREDYA